MSETTRQTRDQARRDHAAVGGWDVSVWRPVPENVDPEGLPVVLLHGFMQQAASWEHVACDLAGRGRVVVAPTMEPPSKGRATLDDFARGAVRLVDWARSAFAPAGRRRVHLAGYSMGGRIAVTAAGALGAEGVQERLASLVLESAGLGPADEQERSAYADRNAAFARKIAGAPDMSAVVDFWQGLPVFASQARLPRQQRDAIRRARLACDKEKLSWTVDSAGAQRMRLAAENRAMLAALGVPVLYLAGKSDAKYKAVAESMERTGSPHVRVRLLDGGHDVHLERPDAYAACVSKFLEKHDGGPGQEDR